MYKEVARNIPNVSIYPIISFLIFFLFFLGLLIWIVKVDKKLIDKMKNIPMDNNPQNSGYEKVD
jgi:cytochrome c oxidase cbb3-type subunit IV